MDSLRSHASLPPEPVNRAVQYLRRFSQDPPGQSNINFHAVYLLWASCYFHCNKELLDCGKSKGILVISSGHTHPHRSTWEIIPRTQVQRTFFRFATPAKIPFKGGEGTMGRQEGGGRGGTDGVTGGREGRGSREGGNKLARDTSSYNSGHYLIESSSFLLS